MFSQQSGNPGSVLSFKVAPFEAAEGGFAGHGEEIYLSHNEIRPDHYFTGKWVFAQGGADQETDRFMQTAKALFVENLEADCGAELLPNEEPSHGGDFIAADQTEVN